MDLTSGSRPEHGSKWPELAGVAIAATLLVLVGFVAVVRFVPVAHAASSPLTVYVGYADDIMEGTSTMFSDPSYPFPWCGSANVSVTGDCTFVDGGAIMIVNTGSSVATVDNVTAFLPANNTVVVYNSEEFDGSVDISPGQAVIFDQDSSNYPLNPPTYDTSEFTTLPPCSIPLVGGQFAPQVILTMNGKNTTYIDMNHVLDTGGSDLGACQGADETTQWQQIYRSGAPGSLTSQSLQPIGGSYGSQPVVGSTWNFTNANVCGKEGTPAQCEAASIGMQGTSLLHLVDSHGNPVPFAGVAVSSGIALGGCQNAFKKLPNLKVGYAAIASCFDAAIVVSGTLGGNITITPKVTLPLSVAGPACSLLKLQVAYLQGKVLRTDGTLAPAFPIGTSAGMVTCGITVGQDASVLGTSALNAAGHTAFTVLEQTPTTATCSSPTQIGAWVLCRAVVSGNSASGKVTWKNDGTPGAFRVGTCNLKVGKVHSSCVVLYRQTSFSSPVALNASYGGDLKNGANSNIFQLAVKQKASSTRVTCTPASLHANSVKPFTCTARVYGYTPTGTVSFSVGFTNKQTCNLVGNSCNVQLFPAGVGHWKLTVTYEGDSNNIGSFTTKILVVIP